MSLIGFPSSSRTCTGYFLLNNVPSPSWPWELSPHVHKVPFSFRAIEKFLPTATFEPDGHTVSPLTVTVTNALYPLALFSIVTIVGPAFVGDVVWSSSLPLAKLPIEVSEDVNSIWLLSSIGVRISSSYKLKPTILLFIIWSLLKSTYWSSVISR